MPVSSKILKQLGFEVINFINDNIEAVIDVNNKPFEPYSLGYFIKKKYKKKSRAKTKKARQNAYEKAVAAWQGKGKDVNLTSTGAMLSALSVIAVDEGAGTLTIGFNTSEAANLAYYHNVSGAGAGRVLRKFMGLTDEQRKVIMKKAGLLLMKDQVFIRGLHDELNDKL